jgi:Domain of unknown function (DUF4359)
MKKDELSGLLVSDARSFDRKGWTIIGSIFLILLLLFTNPSQDKHKLALKDKFVVSITKELEKQKQKTGMEGLQSVVATMFIDNMVDKTVTSENWLLFSTTKITIEGNENTIGFGILGHVYLSSEVDDALKEGFNK